MKLTKKKEPLKTEQEKVEERREEVLAKGRKFKYPLQWTKHRIVINTIMISIVIFALITVGGWLALYRLGMTDDLLYRVTEMLPIPVANVDSENVLFSDYLMLYRSSMTSIERQSGSQFDQSSLDDLKREYKRTALNDAESYTYAIKLAKEHDVTVTDDDIKNEFEYHLKIGGVDRSEEAFMKIVEDNFGLNKNEYERMLYLSLMRSKVEMKIDERANEVASKVEALLSSNNNDYQAVASELGDAVIYEETGGLVDNKNIDGGRAVEAFKLEPGQSSERFVSMNGDGYYFVKLVSKTESQVNFVSIRVPFTVFGEQFNKLHEENKIVEHISISDAATEMPAPAD